MKTEELAETGMKLLFLMRHAKSSWADENLPDHQRPLNRRGRHAAPLMGQWFIDTFPAPDLLIASTAARTRETAARFSADWFDASQIVFDRRLYHAPAEDLIDFIREIDDSVNSLLLIGHNPGLRILISQLARQMLDVPTAALGAFELGIDRWAGCSLSTPARLIIYQEPRELTQT